MTRRSKVITESRPLVLGPGKGRDGVGALWRAGSAGAFNGVYWFSGTGGGGTLSPRWGGFESLKLCFW